MGDCQFLSKNISLALSGATSGSEERSRSGALLATMSFDYVSRYEREKRSLYLTLRSQRPDDFREDEKYLIEENARWQPKQ